ncbi:MAG: hypothetical protein H7Z38_21700 [Rubrivivax sp.]|nr:hypothetical protein [Pyrinomonadaceae bacterium]
MSGGDPPIIITGGSVTIEFDQSAFSDEGRGRYTNQEKVIKRVEITGDGIQNYDSSASGQNVVVKITYGNP